MVELLVRYCFRHPVKSILIGLATILTPIIIFITLFIIIISSLSNINNEESNGNCGSGSSAAVSSNVSGSSGEWTQKGTKAYNAAKAFYKQALNDKMDSKHAAALVGNGIEESGDFGLSVGESFSLWPHQSSGPGVGVFMFTPGQNVPSDKSIQGQIQAILKNGPTSDFLHASGSINDLTEKFRADFERGDVNSQRQSNANKAYQMFHGLGGASDADATADSGGSSCDSDYGGGTDYIKFEKNYLGLGYSEGTHVQGAEGVAKGTPKDKVQETDCSGMVWGVLKHCGYGVSSQPWVVGNGGSENAYFKDHHETVNASGTKAGTVVMANENAHTAILLEKWHGKNTKIIEEGGYGNNCNIEPYWEAFGSNNGPDEFANPRKA